MKKFLSLVLAACMLMSVCAFAETAEEPSYTYNTYASTFPTNWNPHQYKTATDNDAVLSYITDGFYEFTYNDTMDSYTMIPTMVVGDPVDVTADYVGEKWGIEEGDTARAWKYTLRDDLKWEDGTPITAADFVYSAMKQLNPLAANYRADSLYSGSAPIHNAEAYAKSGIYAYSSQLNSDLTNYIDESEYTVGDDGYYTLDGKDVVICLKDSNKWSSNTLEDYNAAGGYISEDIWNVLSAAADTNGYVKVTAEIVDTMQLMVANLHGAATVEDYAASQGDYAYQEWEEFALLGSQNDEMSFDDVGVQALSDTELVFIVDKPLLGFQLKYNLGLKQGLVREVRKVREWCLHQQLRHFC